MTTREELEKGCKRNGCGNSPDKLVGFPSRFYCSTCKAKIEGYDLGRKSIKNQNCKLCGKPDEYSDETICGKCIGKWKEVLINKGRKEALEEAINGLVKIYSKEGFLCDDGFTRLNIGNLTSYLEILNNTKADLSEVEK